MAKVHLSAKLVQSVTCPQATSKATYFDLACKGLQLEVRSSGGKTWYLRYTDVRGKQRQYRLGDAQDIRLDQARKLANDARARLAAGEDPFETRAARRATPTFAEFAHEQYLPFARDHKRSWQSDESYLRNHLLPAFGRKHLDEISKREVLDFHHAIRASGRAPATANRCLILLRYMFNLAKRWEVPGGDKNPTAGAPLLKENNKRERFLSREEARRLKEALQRSDNPHLQFIVPLLLMTGARKRELLDARWADFDLDRQSWRIPICKLGEARHVPLSDGAIDVLTRIPRVKGCSYVVPNPKTLRPYRSIFCSWNTARKLAGMPDLRMHDLRHSFASFLVNSGRSLYEVQKLLGHTQMRTTSRYAHLAPETLLDAANAAVNALGTAFRPGRPDERSKEPLQ